MSLSACNLRIIPLRANATHRSEMVSQVLFGEVFEILAEEEDFVQVQLLHPTYQGWIQRHQYDAIVHHQQSDQIVDLAGATAYAEGESIELVHGTTVPTDGIQIGAVNFAVQGSIRNPVLDDFAVEFPKLISHYKDTPYMWGGRSTAGIDCSGLSQVIYKHFGIPLKRDAWQQAESGRVVDFLSEIKPGDLAFFDNEAGHITHVGVIIDGETILHASAKVRIDRLDSEGIFNVDLNKYTHKLRIVKRYF